MYFVGNVGRKAARLCEITYEAMMRGIAAVFPEAHAQFVRHLPEGERNDLLGSYLRRLTDPDPAVHMAAARAWSTT